jgi:hypothetical protein
MKKSVWITTLQENDPGAAALARKLGTYGLACYGQTWDKGPGKMPWLLVRAGLASVKASVWVIAAGEDGLDDGELRYGLSLAALGLQNDLPALPIIVLHNTPGLVIDSLPGPLAGAKVMASGDHALGAKLTAAVHGTAKKAPKEYRLDVLGDPHIGVWLETGPVSGEWKGAFFGVKGGDVLFQAVGPRGTLPERTVLEQAMRGMKIEHRGEEYTAWAVHNPLNDQTSHFVKILGPCETVLFGEMSGGDSAEAFVIPLR